MFLLWIPMLNLINSPRLLDFIHLGALLLDSQCFVLVLQALNLLYVLVLNILIKAMLCWRMASVTNKLLRRDHSMLRWGTFALLNEVVPFYWSVYFREFARTCWQFWRCCVYCRHVLWDLFFVVLVSCAVHYVRIVFCWLWEFSHMSLRMFKIKDDILFQ